MIIGSLIKFRHRTELLLSNQQRNRYVSVDEGEIAMVLGHAANDAIIDVFCAGRGRGMVFVADAEIVR